MKIGFIDWYLDEWHAQEYPAWIKEQSGGKDTVCYAFAATSPANRKDNAAWCAERGIELLTSMEEVIEKSDCLAVLAPDDPEVHLSLATPALKSGKPVFVDKTFADTCENAKKMFEIAAAHHTPLYSSSALRYSEKLQAVDTADIDSVAAVGSVVEVKDYIIHLLEPIAVLMGTAVQKVMYTGHGLLFSFTLLFKDGRTATLHLTKKLYEYNFKIAHADACESMSIDDNFWYGAIETLLEFFHTGIPPVKAEETIAIMAIKDTCFKAMQTPGEWVAVD